MAEVDVTRIAGNIGAMNALNSLQNINKQLSIHQTRLATGKRINTAADDPAWLALATLPERGPLPAFPLKSTAFTTRGIAKGPLLGAALKAAEQAWIAAGFPTDKRSLDAIVEQTLRTNVVS